MSEYRIRPAFSCRYSSREGVPVNAGSFLIMRGDSLLMSGRTFSRDDAEAIRDALIEAHECGVEEILGEDWAA